MVRVLPLMLPRRARDEAACGGGVLCCAVLLFVGLPPRPRAALRPPAPPRAPPPIGVECRVSPGVTRDDWVWLRFIRACLLEVYRAARSGEAAEFASPGPRAGDRVRKIKFLFWL